MSFLKIWSYLFFTRMQCQYNLFYTKIHRKYVIYLTKSDAIGEDLYLKIDWNLWITSNKLANERKEASVLIAMKIWNKHPKSVISLWCCTIWLQSCYVFWIYFSEFTFQANHLIIVGSIQTLGNYTHLTELKTARLPKSDVMASKIDSKLTWSIIRLV